MPLKVILAILIVALLALQYRLWFGHGSFAHIRQLNKEVAEQQAINAELAERNRLLREEVEALKNSQEAIENQARSELGLIKKGETLYRIPAKQ